MQRHSPFPGNPLGRQIDQFQQGHVTGKGPLILSHFPNLTVVAFDRIGRITRNPQWWRVSFFIDIQPYSNLFISKILAVRIL